MSSGEGDAEGIEVTTELVGETIKVVVDTEGAVGESEDKGGVGTPLDTEYEKLGTQRIHYIFAIILGIGNAADAVELLVIGYILPQIDEIDELGKGILSGSVFLGMLVGGLFFGYLSDRYGRKPSLLICLAINFLFGSASALSPFWQVLVLLRIASGFGIGGSVPCVFSMASELVPPDKRGRLVTIVALFWMVGSILIAVVAWIILEGFGWSWRVLAALSGLPALFCVALVLLLVPESPRYFFLRGNYGSCYDIMQVVSKRSKKELGIRRDAFIQLCEQYEKEKREAEAPKKRGKKGLWRRVKEANMWKLFGKKLGFRMWVMLFLWWALNFGWYGLILWMPTLFKKMGGLNNYASALIVAIGNLPGNVVTLVFLDILGRKKMLIGSLAAAFFMMLMLTVMLFVVHSVQDIVPKFIEWGFELMALFIFNALAIVAWNTIDCLSSELFPTQVRAMAVGILSASGRLSSALAQVVNGVLISYVSVYGVPIVMLISTAHLLMGMIAAFALPRDPNKQRLHDF